jgi:multidrug efflux pump
LQHLFVRHHPEGILSAAGHGRLIGNIQGPGISFQAMQQKLRDFVTIVRADHGVENVVAFTGGGKRNGGFHVRDAEPLSQRAIPPTR